MLKSAPSHTLFSYHVAKKYIVLYVPDTLASRSHVPLIPYHCLPLEPPYCGTWCVGLTNTSLCALHTMRGALVFGI